jgi:DNA-binding transcriptional MocR family regulator
LAEFSEITCVMPQGGPFLFLNIERIFSTSEAASEALLAVGVPTVPGWYCQSDTHVRLAMGASPPKLAEVIRRIGQVAHAYSHG